MGRKRGLDKVDTDEELQAITRGLKRIVKDRTAKLEEAKRELEASEEKLRLIFETIEDGVIVTDLTGTIVEANEAVLRLAGYSNREELIGRSAFEFVSPKDRAPAMDATRKTFEEEHVQERREYAILTADGRELETEASAALLHDSFGNPAGIINVVRDITERKRIQEALRISEEQYTDLVEREKDIIYTLDATGNITSANSAVKILRYRPEELIGKNFAELLPTEWLEKTVADFNNLLNTGEITAETVLLDKKGEPHFVEYSSTVIEEDGKVVGTRGIVRDITERKRAEEALRESEERLRAFIQNAPDAIFVYDLMGTFIDGNRKAEELVGYSKKELIGKSFFEAGLLPEEYVQAAVAAVEKNIRGEVGKPHEFELIAKQGSRVTVEITSFPVAREGNVEVMGIARDITERKRAEEALRESEERYRTILEDIEDGYFEVDIAGNFTFFNDPMCGIIGYSRDEMIGMNNRQYMDKQNAKKVYQAFNRVFTTGIPSKEFGWEIIRKDGVKRFIESSVSLIKNSEGEPIGFRGIVRDITERKRMEEALQESEQKYRVLFESGLDGAFVIDAETMTVVLANQLAAKMYGFDSAEDALGVNPLDFIHPDDRERTLSIIVEDMFEKDLRQVEEFRTITKDGKQRWISAVGTTIEYQGRLAGLVSLSDITERKRAERMVMERTAKLEKAKRELEETASHLNTLQAVTGVGLSPMGLDEMLQELLNRLVQGVETSFGVIWLLDEERGELLARASLRPEGLELSLEEFTLDVVETSFFELFRVPAPVFLGEKDFPSLPIDDKIKKALKDTQIKSLMLVPLTYQGKVIGAACCGWRIRREFTPRERGLFQIIADRAATAIEFHRLNEETRRKSVELEQKNIELVRVNELKSEFLANMSHELRTPMNAIMGYTSLMLRERYGTVTEKQAEALWRVDRNAKNLLSLITNILDLSKIEAGKMPLYNEEVDLGELMEEVISTVEPMVREAKLELEMAMAEDIPALWTDRSKLKQTILNLVSNAVKFTEKGEVTVSACGSDGHVKVAVKDTGIGIKEEDLKVIFEEFRQLDGSTTRDKGGSGLGLAIAKKFANLLGGDIKVESVYGQGSTFTITIPCSAPPQPPRHIPEPIAEVPARPTTAAKTILAIDDDPEIIALLRENLTDTDYEVVGALSAEDGIRMAAELQPFAITLDILMPHRDGWYVIHKLKSDPKTAHIPVIVISIIEEKHLAYSLGVADYIVKPIERDLLISKLKHLKRVGQGEALVVDNDPKVVNILRDILQGEGYSVRAALSWRDAISEIEAKPPDYLFLDIEMLEIDGFNVLNHVGKKPYGRDMIVVVTSARNLTPEERDLLSKRASIMMEKSKLHKKEAVEELKLALTAAQGKKGVQG